MTPSSATTTKIPEITGSDQSEANSLLAKRNIGEKTETARTEVEFLPIGEDERDYLIVSGALTSLQKPASRGAIRLGLKTDEDVFEYMKANKKFE